ncbi:MAG: GMC family oxidoreductase [Nitrospinae bacterium]|nr:GMC family oxidoreductase [Nitrospinota bacterium]
MKSDFFRDGIASGWNHIDASSLSGDTVLEADVAIVGAGAGGGVSAEIFSKAGLKVVMVEEGSLSTTRDFNMLESEAYPALFQESASRKTRDKGIDIFQGRCVGGGTLVNWTASFRTPPATLKHWEKNFGVAGLGTEELRPWFEKMESRFNIKPWDLPPNRNNDVLRSGAEKLGYSWGVIPRNVRDCRNLGYCGLGCPVRAKQDTLVTSVADALVNGATLVSRARAERIVMYNGNAKWLDCVAMDENGIHPRKTKISIRAKHFVLSAGAIGTPALLLRSRLPDPHGLIGKRTFIHPVSVSGAIFPEPVEGFYGAPQSVYSDHFLYPDDGKIGFKLETPPIYPVMAATKLCGFGVPHAEFMKSLANAQVIIALNVDGFHAESPGGTVALKKDGTPVLDYPITPYVWEGITRSLFTTARIQFSAGAERVIPFHQYSRPCKDFGEAEKMIKNLPMEVLKAKVVSAHVMGGCPMGGDERTSVVDCEGKLRHAENVFVFDGSVFPTSLGTNPQLSIFALTARNAHRLLGNGDK